MARRHLLTVLLVLLVPAAAWPAKPSCEDGICNGPETALSCPADCAAGSCGDGVCDASESCSSCSSDCGPCSPPTACNNDDVCNLGEDCQSCPGDCAGVLSGRKSERFCCGGASPETLFCSAPQCGADCGTPVSAPVCGNALVELPEECDDGNTTAGDGCSATCTLEPACGNGILDAGEQCDDGNQIAGDGCDASCRIESPAAGVPANQFNVGDSIGEAEAADGTIGSVNHASVWSTGFSATDIVSSHNERFESTDGASYYENDANRDPVFNKAISGSVMADFAGQAEQIVAATAAVPSNTAGRIAMLLGNNDVCADSLQAMTDVGQFETQFRAGLDVLAGSPATRQASISVTSIPAIYWLWESRADDSPFSWCRLFAWPFVPCQNLLASSADDCASLASRADPDTVYPGDGANCQRRKQFHARIRDEYNPLLKDVVDEYASGPLPNIEYVDVFDVRFDKIHVNGGDCFHPSLEGHKLLSDEQLCRSTWSEGDPACAP